MTKINVGAASLDANGAIVSTSEKNHDAHHGVKPSSIAAARSNKTALHSGSKSINSRKSSEVASQNQHRIYKAHDFGKMADEPALDSGD